MKRSSRDILILLALAIIVALPSLATGLQSLRRAELPRTDAPGWRESAAEYARAARLLPWRVDLWQQAGLAAWRANDPGLALGYFERAQRYNALTDAFARYARGDSLWQQGQLETAQSEWEAMWAEGIQNAPMFARLAAIYEAAGDFDAAIAARRAQLELEPADADARYRLGVMLASRADPAALNELVRTAQDDPTLDPVVRSVRTALNSGFLQPDAAYQLVSAGRGLGEAGEWVLAQAAFIGAIETNKTYAEAWAWLGEARTQIGFDDGGQYVEYAYRLNPRSTMVLVLYGLYHQRSGDETLALRAYEAVVQSEPENPLWWATLAAMQAQDGQFQAALSSYQQAIALSPQEPVYYKLLAGFCADYEFEVLEVGARAAVRARNLAPDDPEARVLQARLMLLSGYESAAVKLLQQALELDPQNVAANYYMGFIYFNRNEMDLARMYLSRAREEDPHGAIGAQAANILDRYFP